ncbi:hypothetical protein N7471_006065 [Penicillium samsonianum]|uniref:uncharacterized protein n=1 Tax=Penicillium samsonianum TaxID=1882272 RepID=UPI002549B2DB|nr:uncharacterized protein N7471_006065 [Penicillium samsonianum]KAJ6139579.1 hypothetical protein N7471_006065 [Penicillium samsonianum]
MQYTTSEVNHRENLCDLPNAPIIDIGEVYENVIRWWYAILAQHEDGKPLSNDPAATNFSPPGPCLAYKIGSPTFVYTTLSSDEAFDALAKFALLHNLGSQFPIALMTAITLPTHQYHGSTVQLPFPRTTGGKQPTTPMDAIPLNWSKQKTGLLSTHLAFPGPAVLKASWILQVRDHTRMEILNTSQGQTYSAYYTFLKPKMTIYCLALCPKPRGHHAAHPYQRIVRFESLHT